MKKVMIAIGLIVYLVSCESHMHHIKKYNETEKPSVKERRDSHW